MTDKSVNVDASSGSWHQPDRVLDSCPRDCPRRCVGCRTDCPDWQEHERRKAERYEAARREEAAKPASAAWHRNYNKQLRRQARGQK